MGKKVFKFFRSSLLEETVSYLQVKQEIYNVFNKSTERDRSRNDGWRQSRNKGELTSPETQLVGTSQQLGGIQ